MPKSYPQFNYDDLYEFGLSVAEKPFINEFKYSLVEPSELLKMTLERNTRRKLRSEKAKSEFLISPILAELEESNPNLFACFSGYKFNVDPKKGLNGFCDFVLSFKPHAFNIEAPVFCIVESKNENIEEGIPQCIAEMYAAQIFNDRAGKPRPVIYGAVTYGQVWKFIRLIKNDADVDTQIFFLNQLPEILGIMQYIVDHA
jgi:hypothetical protein